MKKNTQTLPKDDSNPNIPLSKEELENAFPLLHSGKLHCSGPLRRFEPSKEDSDEKPNDNQITLSTMSSK
ncbi:hypothetical protein [Pseudodesulfovibrio sp. zrk46]|uniref:hypothetical protein n=1 Tax=Pseudodesulfovibrio sp. zrk46 TaxID=2725288 RepID=UPI0014491228|nr:hypothetical protein [Pseudodesulfovibrio sp. zrk46]QJB56895.1 hypothetical protein HFN16_10985 [Pseudodesulfovibrio sp. zrk46]